MKKMFVILVFLCSVLTVSATTALIASFPTITSSGVGSSYSFNDNGATIGIEFNINKDGYLYAVVSRTEKDECYWVEGTAQVDGEYYPFNFMDGSLYGTVDNLLSTSLVTEFVPDDFVESWNLSENFDISIYSGPYSGYNKIAEFSICISMFGQTVKGNFTREF
jgi:hypothetical protein